VSPRVVRSTNEYQFSAGTEPGEINQKQTAWQAFGKMSYAANKVHANASLLMTPTRSTGRLPAYDAKGTNWLTTSLAANQAETTRGFESDQTNVSSNVDIWLRNNSYLSARGGYFSDSYTDTGVPNITSYTYQTPNFTVPGVPPSLQGPSGTFNTPRIQISNFDTTKQGFVQLDYNHSFNAGGSHLLKGGWGLRHSSNDVDVSYPGGYVYLYWGQAFRSTATGQTGTGTYGYYAVHDLATRGDVNANIQNLFIQDSWTIGSRLTLNLGVRTENEKIPTFAPEIRPYGIEFGFGDKIAPRLGASFDVKGDGRVKAFASWGRYYDWTRYEIARGSYGGDLWHIFYRSLDTLDIARDTKGSWTVDGVPVKALKGCIDVDLGCSPSTNTLPIRRLRLGDGQSKTIQAAWVRFPSLTVEKGAQTYTRIDEFTYRYKSGTFEAELIVDDDGIVAQYAEWQRTAVAMGPDDTEPLDGGR